MEDIEKVKEYYTRLLHEIIDDADTLNKSQPLTKMTRSVMIAEREMCLDQLRELAGFLAQVYAQVEAISLEVQDE